jgi:hypothetical protein
MKKQIHILTIVAVAALISFCVQPTSPVEAIELNTFDADGNLCLIGGDSPQEIGTPMELWMGVGNEDAGTLVGSVTFDANNVIIDLTDANSDGILDMFPYVLTAVHIHFAPDVESVPHTNKGNPIQGQFEYSPYFADYHDGYDPTQSHIVVPVEFAAVGAIHISAIQYGGLDALEYYLPNDPVQMQVKYPKSGNPSYLGMTLDDANQMDGYYESWCGDVDNFIEQNTWYISQMYSLHDPDLPTDLFETPENLDKVNYLINTYYVGMEVQPLDETCAPITSCGAVAPEEALTYGDIQVAIWTLVEDTLPDNLSDFAALAQWSQGKVNAILCDVNVNGDEFSPTCETHPYLLTSFIVVPDDGAQLQISTIEVPCETTDGTAWGDGKFGEVFPGAKQWGTYFNYDANCVSVP